MVEFGKSHDGRPLHPGRILLVQAMEPLGISRNQLARDIDVPVGRVSDITNGKRGITADTALRLGRYFGTGPELWLRLQAEYDIHVVRTTTWPAIESRVRVLEVQQSESTPAMPDTKAAAEGGPAIEDEMEEPIDIDSFATEPSALTAPEHPDQDPGLESAPRSWNPSERVPEPDEMDLDTAAVEEQREDGAGTDLEDDEALGIPPVPGAASRIVSG